MARLVAIFLAVIYLFPALCLSFSADNPTDRRLLVLVDDLAVRSSHSVFFKSLQTRGFDLDFKLADDPKLSLQRYGQYLYDGLILFSPSIQRFGGSLDQNAVLEFVDAGHDLILAADSSASDLIRGIATECGVDFDEDSEAVVIDHTSYAVSEMEGDHNLITSDDLIQSDVILGDRKIELDMQPCCLCSLLAILRRAQSTLIWKEATKWMPRRQDKPQHMQHGSVDQAGQAALDKVDY